MVKRYTAVKAILREIYRIQSVLILRYAIPLFQWPVRTPILIIIPIIPVGILIELAQLCAERILFSMKWENLICILDCIAVGILLGKESTVIILCITFKVIKAKKEIFTSKYAEF